MSLYQPLSNPASFRLIRVHRDAYGAITCELKSFVHGAIGTPQYLPVSYELGVHSRQVTVSINGHRKATLRSAFEVLELVCDQPEFLYRPWLFLESICINPESLEERTAYATLRTRIFGESNGALIWLGPASQNSEAGMDMMRLAAEPSKHQDPRLKDRDCWVAYGSIVQRPWWRCVGTLYESLAPQVHREVLYYCGTKHLTGREVIWAAAETPRLLDQIVDDGSSQDHTWAPLLARRRIWQWYRGIEPGERISLLALLAHNAGSIVQDDRDRIYGLLSCVKRIDRDLVGIPRYDVPVESIYTQLVRDWINTHHSLDIFSFAAPFRDRGIEAGRLPSWVPDWRVMQDAQYIQRCRSPVPLMVSQSTRSHISNLRPMDQLKIPTTAPTYAAAGATSPEIEYHEDGQVLRVKGIVLDAVDGLTGIPGKPHVCTEPLAPIVQPTSPFNCLADLELGVSSSRAIDKQYGHIDVVGGIMRDDVLMSLTVGRADDYLHHKADHRLWNAQLRTILEPAASDGDERTGFRGEFLAWLQLNASFKVCSRPLGTLLGASMNNEDEKHEYTKASKQSSKESGSFLRRFHATTGEAAWRMRLVVTQQGYVGMAPREARKGDLVCVLLGYSVPAVLRRQDGGTFELIGECYMQGFMEGQVLQDDHHIETFDIT